jgi:hypothetical protein
MQRYSVGEDKRVLYDEWHEIKLNRAVVLYEVCKSMPDKLRERYDTLYDIGNDRERAEDFLIDWIDENQHLDFSRFQIKCINALSDSDVPLNISRQSLSILYYTYLDSIVYGMIYQGITHQPLVITHFEHKGVVYNIPKHRKLWDLDIYFEGIKMAQFTEFSDLLGLVDKAENGFKFVATAIAALCLDDGEDYDESRVQEMSKDLEDLPMDIVWDVFFYSASSCSTSKEDSQICLEFQKGESQQESIIDWDGEEMYWTSPKIAAVFSQFPILSN